jgi:hypothetical protein
MQRQITRKLEWYVIETNQGTWFVPKDDIGEVTELADLKDYVEGTPESFTTREGYGARLSAPGYLDCTEWSVFDTPEQAEEYLDEYYPEDEEE